MIVFVLKAVLVWIASDFLAAAGWWLWCKYNESRIHGCNRLRGRMMR